MREVIHDVLMGVMVILAYAIMVMTIGASALLAAGMAYG